MPFASPVLDVLASPARPPWFGKALAASLVLTLAMPLVGIVASVSLVMGAPGKAGPKFAVLAVVALGLVGVFALAAGGFELPSAMPTDVRSDEAAKIAMVAIGWWFVGALVASGIAAFALGRLWRSRGRTPVPIR